jgi:NAD(P)-dependent dehydrogenase (short-subunit alcohol dehydrogenase family)
MQSIVLISGATRGIGYAAAEALSSRGAKVIIGSRDPERAALAAFMLGNDVSGIGLDMTDAQSVLACADHIARSHGHLDVLVNNSAILIDHYSSLLELGAETLIDTFATNVAGTLRLTQSMLPLLRKASASRVINVSSGAGQLDGEPQAWAPAYSISKTALNMLTQQLTAALPDMAVNSMCPGWCRTEMGGAEAPRSPEEGADTIVWLALDAPHELRGRFIKDRAVIGW